MCDSGHVQYMLPEENSEYASGVRQSARIAFEDAKHTKHEERVVEGEPAKHDGEYLVRLSRVSSL